MYFWDQIILWNSESANVWFVVRMVVSVTRLGDFWKFLATKFLAKEAQMIGNSMGYFEKPYSYLKTALATFSATLGKTRATFYSNIWSHWERQAAKNKRKIKWKQLL